MKTDVRALFRDVDQVLVLVVPGLEAPRELPKGTAFVGPICHPDPADTQALADWGLGEMAKPGTSWVLVSLSTTLMEQAKALAPILEALDSIPARALLTLGGVISADAIRAPTNVLVRDFVPHDFVLPYTDLVVSHGGLSTINGALVAGKPLVCIPQGRDQNLNASHLEASGAGRVIAKDSNAAEIAEAIAEVLEVPSYREAAEQLAVGSLPLGRGRVVTDLIEGLAAERI